MPAAPGQPSPDPGQRRGQDPGRGGRGLCRVPAPLPRLCAPAVSVALLLGDRRAKYPRRLARSGGGSTPGRPNHSGALWPRGSRRHYPGGPRPQRGPERCCCSWWPRSGFRRSWWAWPWPRAAISSCSRAIASTGPKTRPRPRRSSTGPAPIPWPCWAWPWPAWCIRTVVPNRRTDARPTIRPRGYGLGIPGPRPRITRQLPPALARLLDRFPQLRRRPHPMLAHFPIVFLLSATFFSLLFRLTGNRAFDDTAFYCLGGGLLTLPPTVATGLFTHWLNFPAGRTRPCVSKKPCPTR